ncbi:hypothetical protein DV515_00006235 [Chloebia gouldiae]|uniref:PX domain-containing protein n=1 Tax=Chloebia gouldiae TaxID=44316 RepID=A0A3L8SKB2_CHLGU|nr:hypothetical protein DV515_00006235 [Chloebia gouldiae]
MVRVMSVVSLMSVVRVIRLVRIMRMVKVMKMVRTMRMVRLGLMRRTRCLSLSQVFQVEVLCNGRRHTVTKCYSEFQALHKQLKKTCKVRNFPVLHTWMLGGLEQCRQKLEVYLRNVVTDNNEELPQDILDFLKVQWCQQNAKASSPPSTTLLPSQRPIVSFCWDPYVQPHGTELLPNTVLSGVLQGFYLPLSCLPGQAAPQAPGMMSSTQHSGMQW